MKPEAWETTRKRLKFIGLLTILVSLAVACWALLLFEDTSDGLTKLLYITYGAGGLFVGVVLLIVASVRSPRTSQGKNK